MRESVSVRIRVRVGTSWPLSKKANTAPESETTVSLRGRRFEVMMGRRDSKRAMH